MHEPDHRPTFDVTSVDLGGDVVIVADAEGNIVDVNDAFVRVTGYSRQEAIGANPRLLSSGLQQQSTYADMWETILSGRVWSGELVDRHRDGALRTHRVTLTPMTGPDGRVSHVVAVQRDLARDLARQTTVPGIGSLHTDTDGRCIYVDAEGAELLHGDREELFAAGWRRFLVDDDAAAVNEAVQTAISTGREQRMDVRTTDGRWLHLRIAPLRSPDGSDIGTSWSLENVTDLIEVHGELARRDALLSATLEAHEDPTALVDRDGVLMTVNPAWARASGSDHPAFRFTPGDDIVAGLHELAARGDAAAEAAVQELAAHVTGVPPTTTAGSPMRINEIPSDQGGVVVRLPLAAAAKAATNE